MNTIIAESLYICINLTYTQLMDRMKIKVKVHPTVYEFIKDSTGTDTIEPKKEDLIWGILKQHLDTCPPDTEVAEEEEESCFIYIELLDASHHKCYNNSAGRAIKIDTMFRWYLSDKGQNKINNVLRKNFKMIMHTFIMAQLISNPDLEQKDAFDEFCRFFNLSMNRISIDMIKKSWDRSDHKKRLSNHSSVMNAIFC